MLKNNKQTMPSKIIEVHRHFNLVEMQQQDPEVQEWLGSSYRAVGPYWENRFPGSGLDFAEQKLLLPEVIGTEASDKDFRKKVEEFYHSYTTSIPKQGIKLEIGLKEDNEKPMDENNMPLNVKDFIAYRHIRGAKAVAADKIAAERNPTAKFYIKDPDKISDDTIEINDLEDKALQLYFANKDNGLKVDQILTMMGVDLRTFKKNEEKAIKLKSFTQKNPNHNEYVQKETLKKFIAVCEDKDLETKYLIQELIGAQVLEKVGTNILVKESGEKLGDTMKEAVLFVNNPKNTRLLNNLRANFELKVRKGVFSAKEVEKQEVKAD